MQYRRSSNSFNEVNSFEFVYKHSVEVSFFQVMYNVHQLVSSYKLCIVSTNKSFNEINSFESLTFLLLSRYTYRIWIYAVQKQKQFSLSVLTIFHLKSLLIFHFLLRGLPSLLGESLHSQGSKQIISQHFQTRRSNLDSVLPTK